MRVLEVRNYGEMSALAAELIGAQVLLKPRCVLGLATGSSPIGTYERLVEAHRAGRLDFSQVPFMDSSGIGLILGRVRLLQFWKGHVVLCGLSPNLGKMVELSGIGTLASIERRAG